MRSSSKHAWQKIVVGGSLLGFAVFSFGLQAAAPVRAAAGINQQLNFQGRLLDSTGATVSDGVYNIEFKIYQDGDGQSVADATGSPAGVLKWTEDHLNANGQGVTVRNGYLSVQLGSITAFGSNIDWNQDTLWLSVNIGNTNLTCTPFSSCSPDGEMTPMKRLSSSPYAINSGELGGLTSAQYVQLAQGLQTEAGNSTNSIYINKTGTGGNFIDLQAGGTDTFTLTSSGNAIFGNNADHTISVTAAGSGVAGKALTISAGAAGTGGSTLAGGNLVLQGGAGGGTNGNGGNIAIDAGAPNGSGTAGSISIGTSTASAITIGNNSGATGVTLQAGSNGISLTAATTVSANLIVTSAGDVAFQRGSDYSTTGSTNNVNFGTGTLIRLTGASAQTITGIAGGIDGRILTLVNAGSSAATISNLSGGSSANNQINTGTGSDVTLPVGSAMYLVYDGGANVWRIVGSSGGNGVTLQSSTPGTAQHGNFNIDGTGIAGSFDSAVSGTLNLGTTNAAAVLVGVSSSTGTITLQQSGITQVITGSGSAPSNVIKTTTNSASAFVVQNSSANQVFGVDTSANKVLFGKSGAVNGTAVFSNSTNSNTITLAAAATNANYTLTLPTSAPSAGLCIETSTGSATQLVFASCSNNNTNITEVQEWDANNTNVVAVSPSTVGDEMVLTTQIPTSPVTVTGVSGGGVTTWSKVIANNGNGTVNRVEMWVGTVTSTGNSNITVTYSGSPGAEEITATEFTAAGVNASTSWGIESSSSQLNTTSSSTVTFPSATAVNGSELYVGYAQVQHPPATTGSTTGFNYIITSTQHNVITYNTGLAANNTYQPTANQNSAGQSNTIDAVLTAFVTSTSINNTTSLQKANFYVQAASGGTVAGVLEAASTGSADILDLRNSSASNVLAVSSTGNVTINPAASTTALQVQNGSSSVLTVDTSNNKVILGASSSLTGALSFSDASDNNSITLTAPTSVAASYSLALPNNTPTAGLCLGTSPSNANQLIFASCATQVSAASISYVNKWDNHGTSVTTISDSPASIGNLLVFYSHTANTVNVNSISGGGVSSWTKITAYSGGGTPGNIEMWRGVVTTAGAGTITATYSGAAGTNEIVAQEFSMGSANGTWAIDTSGTATTTSSVTTVNYPSLTPLNSSELYTGYAYGGGTMSAGSTSGFTYVATGASKYLTYNTSVTGGTAYAPTATQTASVYASVAAVIAAYSGTSVIVDSTATQEANFNVQAATSGTVAGVLQAASSGSADIFEAKDSSSNNIVAVNASSGLTLGTSNAVSGQLNFNASGNGNTISVAAPSTPGASYTLTLPSTTPAAGQCLATSPNDANQLVFSSCANQVTSVAISFVQNWKGTSGASPATLSTSPVNVGDLMVLFVSFQKADTVSSGGVSGGGCGSAWSKVAATASGSGTDTTSIEMWRCQITSTGSSPISVTWSGPAGTHELAAMEFTTGNTSGSWVVDSSNAQYNSSSSTTVSYPNITPQSTKDLYVGYGAAPNTMSAGSTSGFTYIAGSLSNRYGLYNTSVSAGVGPTASQSGSAVSITTGALIAAYSSSSVISNSTVTQEANFNIQAATTGSVAGVLQAAASGSADVMQIMNAAGTVVDSFGSTGNLLIQPSTASANALRVQTTGGINVLSVNTSSLQVVIGAGSAGEATPSLLVVDSQTGSSSDPTGVNGAMYYNATTHTLRCYVDGAWQTCTGLLYSNTSNSSANNNCTNNCSAFSTYATVPANYCQTGRVFNLTATGYFSSTGSPNLQFGIYYGSNSSSAGSDTLIGTVTPAVTVTSASNNYFQIKDTITCFSTSSMQSGGTATIQTGASTMTTQPITSTGGTTVSTGSANNLYLFPIWDTASTSNTATVTQMTVNAY
jgi:hypothetical protein